MLDAIADLPSDAVVRATVLVPGVGHAQYPTWPVSTLRMFLDRKSPVTANVTALEHDGRVIWTAGAR
jgi:hypothetical protein